MKNITRHVGKLTNLERLPSSRNGNPRFRFFVAGFTCRTSPDSSLGYSIQNYENKEVEVIMGTHYGVATLHSINQVKG